MLKHEVSRNTRNLDFRTRILIIVIVYLLICTFYITFFVIFLLSFYSGAVFLKLPSNFFQTLQRFYKIKAKNVWKTGRNSLKPNLWATTLIHSLSKKCTNYFRFYCIIHLAKNVLLINLLPLDDNNMNITLKKLINYCQ